MADDEMMQVERTEQPDPEQERAWAVLEETLGRIARGQNVRSITEISEAVVILIERFGLTQTEIASRWSGVSQPSISNYFSIRPWKEGQLTGLIPALYERASRNEITLKAAVRASKCSVSDQEKMVAESEGGKKVTQDTVDKYYKKRTQGVPVFAVPIPEHERRPEKTVIAIVVPSWAAEKLNTGDEVEFEHRGRTWKLTLESKEEVV